MGWGTPTPVASGDTTGATDHTEAWTLPLADARS